MSKPDDMTPRRIQRKRTKGWKMPPNTVSVTRPGEFGNPFSVTKCRNVTDACDEWWIETSAHAWRFKSKEEATAGAVQLFEAWLNQPQQRRLLDRAAFALRGKNLACFCPEGSPCHGDVLLRLANGTAQSGGDRDGEVMNG